MNRVIVQPTLLFVCLVLITACAGSGPATKAPTRSEPRSRVLHAPSNAHLKGWQKPYEVDGIQYRPLRDHKGFVETGLASWYGKKFHGRKTSNGETYDMYAMTAAHKTLPLGVSVRVTHLKTGRQAIVRVNDRGPFVAGRVIDLSYSAAQKVGIVGPGTGPVRVEALGYSEKGESGGTTYRAPVSYDVGHYAIQVGAFTVKANAERFAQKVRARYGASHVQPGLWRDGTVYRVWAGDYGSLTKAEQAKQKFRAQGYRGAFVVAFDQ